MLFVMLGLECIWNERCSEKCCVVMCCVVSDVCSISVVLYGDDDGCGGFAEIPSRR